MNIFINWFERITNTSYETPIKLSISTTQEKFTKRGDKLLNPKEVNEGKISFFFLFGERDWGGGERKELSHTAENQYT